MEIPIKTFASGSTGAAIAGLGANHFLTKRTEQQKRDTDKQLLASVLGANLMHALVHKKASLQPMKTPLVKLAERILEKKALERAKYVAPTVASSISENNRQHPIAAPVSAGLLGASAGLLPGLVVGKPAVLAGGAALGGALGLFLNSRLAQSGANRAARIRKVIESLEPHQREFIRRGHGWEHYRALFRELPDEVTDSPLELYREQQLRKQLALQRAALDQQYQTNALLYLKD